MISLWRHNHYHIHIHTKPLVPHAQHILCVIYFLNWKIIKSSSCGIERHTEMIQSTSTLLLLLLLFFSSTVRFTICCKLNILTTPLLCLWKSRNNSEKIKNKTFFIFIPFAFPFFSCTKTHRIFLLLQIMEFIFNENLYNFLSFCIFKVPIRDHMEIMSKNKLLHFYKLLYLLEQTMLKVSSPYIPFFFFWRKMFY